MKGQWIGSYTGNVDGEIMVNIDELDDCYEGVAYLNPNEKGIPSTVAYLNTENKENEQKVVAFVNPVDPRTGYQCQWEEIKHLYGDDATHSKNAEVHLKLDDNKLIIDAVSDIKAKVSCTLNATDSSKNSKINSQVMTWDEYKNFVSSLLQKKHLFRGQEKDWPLRTSFHRRERYRISHFIRNDVQQLHKRLCAITNHFFDLNDPQQNGAFFNLLQHHGYPTPLLDWSYSPYVSAFFAFRGWPKNYSGNENVRIFIFDNEKWQKYFPQISNLDPSFQHLSVSDFIALDNPRKIPQQALTTVTNVYDIEAYIAQKEKETKESFIKAIDIPAKFRNTVMQELTYMGITAGSMFPGIDGVCEEMREMNFEK